MFDFFCNAADTEASEQRVLSCTNDLAGGDAVDFYESMKWEIEVLKRMCFFVLGIVPAFLLAVGLGGFFNDSLNLQHAQNALFKKQLERQGFDTSVCSIENCFCFILPFLLILNMPAENRHWCLSKSRHIANSRRGTRFLNGQYCRRSSSAC